MSLGAGHVWRTVNRPELGYIECVACGRLRLFLRPADKRWQRHFARVNRFAKDPMQPDHKSTGRWLFGHGPIGTCPATFTRDETIGRRFWVFPDDCT